MKKIILSLSFLVLPLVIFSETLPTPSANPSLNDTLQSLIKLQQQENQLQNQMNTLKMQQNQLLQQFIQANNNVISNSFKWVALAANETTMPENAVNAGLNDAPKVYICHAQYNNLGLHPGTLEKNGCLISYAGNAYLENNFQVLTGTHQITWKGPESLNQYPQPQPIFEDLNASQNFVIPQNNPPNFSGSVPIVGGYEKGHNLYICRAIVGNQIHVGKVVFNNCNIGYEGKEFLAKDYQVLFAN